MPPPNTTGLGELALDLVCRRVRVGGLSVDHHLVEPPSTEVHADLFRLPVVEPVQLLAGCRPVDFATRACDKPSSETPIE